jgi:hypothetical protein
MAAVWKSSILWQEPLENNRKTQPGLPAQGCEYWLDLRFVDLLQGKILINIIREKNQKNQ